MRDILVHLDGEGRTTTLCAVATGLGRRFGARVTALFGRLEATASARAVGQTGPHLRERAEQCRVIFSTAAADAGIDWRWWPIESGAGDRILSAARLCSHYADLVIVGQEEEDSRSPDGMLDQIIHHSGRPVLVVPRVGSYPAIGERIVVGWNAGRASTRALHDALPFLRTARAVTLLTIHDTPDPSLYPVDAPRVDMIDHLSRWEITATESHPVRDGVGEADLLLSRASDLGADLLVIGASSRSALSFHGSVTRFILGHMPLPVLFSC